MVQLVVDTSELTHLTDSLKSQLTPAQFDKMMRYVQSDVKKNARTMIRKAVQEEYEAKPQLIFVIIMYSLSANVMVQFIQLQISAIQRWSTTMQLNRESLSLYLRLIHQLLYH